MIALAAFEVLLQQQRRERQHVADVVEPVPGVVRRELGGGVVVHADQVADRVAVLDPVEPADRDAARVGILPVDPERPVLDPVLQQPAIVGRRLRLAGRGHDPGPEILEHRVPQLGCIQGGTLIREPVERHSALLRPQSVAPVSSIARGSAGRRRRTALRPHPRRPKLGGQGPANRPCRLPRGTPAGACRRRIPSCDGTCSLGDPADGSYGHPLTHKRGVAAGHLAESGSGAGADRGGGRSESANARGGERRAIGPPGQSAINIVPERPGPRQSIGKILRTWPEPAVDLRNTTAGRRLSPPRPPRRPPRYPRLIRRNPPVRPRSRGVSRVPHPPSCSYRFGVLGFVSESIARLSPRTRLDCRALRPPYGRATQGSRPTGRESRPSPVRRAGRLASPQIRAPSQGSSPCRATSTPHPVRS